jgi:hypothetical protein
MSDTTIQDLMTRNLFEVFGERDGDRRAAAIAEVHAPDTTMYVGGEVIEGAAAVSSHVQALLDGAPGFVFRAAGAVGVNHDLGRLDWEFGPEGAPPVVTGTDIALVADGRIRSLYTFVDAPEAG